MNHSSMTLLAFEAATQVCSAALMFRDKIICRHEKTMQTASQFLLPMIDELLKEANIFVTDLTAIAVGHGPGSFMGIRLALGLAQGLAYPYDIPIIGIPTLQILAQTAYRHSQSTAVLAAWDARMHEIYYGAYQLNEQGIMQQLGQDQLIAPCQLTLPNGHYTLAGNAWSIYYDDFSQNFKRFFSKHVCNDAWIYPDAQSLLTIAQSRFSSGAYTTAANVQPVYLRNRVTN